MAPQRAEFRFISPELGTIGADEDISGFDKKSNWDVAVRYQDLKRLLSIDAKDKEKLKARAIAAILEQAKAVVGPMQKPNIRKTLSSLDCIALGVSADFNAEATVQEVLALGQNPSRTNIGVEHLYYDALIEKEAFVTLVMDASLSMTSEKIALLAVAAAVVLLTMQTQKVSLIAFASKAKVIKSFNEDLTPVQVIERILEIPTHGLTNIEEALVLADKVAHSAKGKKPANVVLISDGKYTEGKDPVYLAKKFRRLHALKIGRDIAGRLLLIDLVRQGSGKLFEARKMSDLPKTMYSVMRLVMR